MEKLDEYDLCFPQCFNTSCRVAKPPFYSAVLSYIFLSFISLLTVTLNLLVIISISHYKKLHTQTNFLLLSLAVSDFFVGILMLFQVGLVSGCWFLGDFICTVYYILDYTITSASIGNMVLISVDRYVAICDPLRYPIKVTETRVKICIFMCWSCSTIFHCANFMDSLLEPGKDNHCVGECVIAVNYIVGIIDLILSFIVPVVIIIVLYIRIFVVVVSQARTMRSHTAASSQHQAVSARANKSEMKAARTLGFLVLVFLVCICPYFCVTLSGQDTLFNASSASAIICLFYLNSCLNPLIYTICYPWFKKSVKLIITLQIMLPESREANVMEK